MKSAFAIDVSSVLLVEHDKTELAPLASRLRDQGLKVFHLGATAAKSHIERSTPDVVVIGRLSEAQERGRTCRTLREATRGAPMLILVSLPRASSVLRGHVIEQGADDCSLAPMTQELFAERLHIIAARSTASEQPTLRHGALEMRIDEQKLFHGADRIRLRPALFDLLRHFLERPDHIHTVEELIDVIGKRGVARQHLAVASRVDSLRASLAMSGIESVIRTIGSRGYALTQATINS